LFKEAKEMGKHAFWCTVELFIDNTPLSKGIRTRKTYAWYYGTCTRVV
jgi:hypothetical protein